MPTKQDIMEIIDVENAQIRRDSAASESPMSPPIIISGPTRQKVLDELQKLPEREKTSYNFFVFGKASKRNFIQVAAPDPSVKRLDNSLDKIDGLAFVNTGGKATRAFFDFDCPVFENEDVVEKSKRLHDWIIHSFWPAVRTFCKVPQEFGRKVVISTKHRRDKASFHLISTDVLAEDCRVWAYLMKDFWAKHQDLLKESWAFMGSEACPNKNANGVEDGAPRGRADGSPVHQWVEHGRTTHKTYTLGKGRGRSQTQDCSAWDAHPQRIYDRSQPLFFVKADKKRYGTNVKRRLADLDHDARMRKFARVSASSDVSKSSSHSEDSEDAKRVWDAYPKYKRLIKLSFEEISKRTDCSIYDISLQRVGAIHPGGLNFIINYRAGEKAKECPLVEGHRHSKNHAKFMIRTDPHFVLLGGCHSTNHSEGTPNWKKLLEFKMAPFEPPEAPSDIIDIGEKNLCAHMVYMMVPPTREFRVRIKAGDKSVDVTNKTEDHDRYSIRINRTLPKLAHPSCINVDSFIKGPCARDLVKKCYYLFSQPH